MSRARTPWLRKPIFQESPAKAGGFNLVLEYKEIIEAVLTPDLGGLEVKLARQGYGIAALNVRAHLLTPNKVCRQENKWLIHLSNKLTIGCLSPIRPILVKVAITHDCRGRLLKLLVLHY